LKLSWLIVLKPTSGSMKSTAMKATQTMPAHPTTALHLPSDHSPPSQLLPRSRRRSVGSSSRVGGGDLGRPEADNRGHDTDDVRERPVSSLADTGHAGAVCDPFTDAGPGPLLEDELALPVEGECCVAAGETLEGRPDELVPPT
jgi:hypothetical protein